MNCLLSSLAVPHSVRLVGGRNKSEGYVQVFGYSWTSICTDEFNMIDAAVTCRQLGYNYATAVVNDGRFSRDELGTRQWSNLTFDCSGNEQRLDDCFRRFSPTCITGNELVGVVCSQTSTCVCAISDIICTMMCMYICTYVHVCCTYIYNFSDHKCMRMYLH